MNYNALTEERFVALLTRYSKKYYGSDTPAVSDNEYDRAVRIFSKRFPSNPYLKSVGTRLIGKDVKLPFVVGSQRKIRPGSIEAWCKSIKEECYVCEPKLDGLTGLIKFKDGRYVGAARRGDGHTGTDISKIAHYVQGVLPVSNWNRVNGEFRVSYKKGRQYFHIPGNLWVRGEFILFDSLFEKYFKGKSGYTSARNTASGILNRVKLSPENRNNLRKLTFVAYDIVMCDGKGLKILSQTEQLHLLAQLGFITVCNPSRYVSKKYHEMATRVMQEYYDARYKIMRQADFDAIEAKYNKFFGRGKKGGALPTYFFSPITEDTAKRLIEYYAKHVDFQIDGIVVKCESAKTIKAMGAFTDDRPKWSTAVKLDPEDQHSKVGTVKRIEWNITKSRILRPVITLTKALDFKGAKVSRIYGNNYKFVKAMGIGPGAKISIIRSGDVIPRVMETKVRARFIRPRCCPYCGSVLKTNDVNLYCDNPDCSGIEVGRLYAFFEVLNLDNLKEATITQLVKAGYNTIPKLLSISEKELMQLDGYQVKKAKAVYTSLHTCLQGASLAKIMHASNYFVSEKLSLGEARLEILINHLSVKSVMQGAKLTHSVEGLGPKSRALYNSRIKDFLPFLNSLRPFWSPVAPKKASSQRLSGYAFAWTGVRQKALEDLVRDNGGLVTNGVTKRTTHVIFKSAGSSKYLTAEKRGLPLIAAGNAEAYIHRLLNKKE